MADKLFHMVGSLIFVVLAGGTFMVLIPARLLSWPHRLTFETGVFRYVGLAPILVGLMVCLWCWRAFITRGGGTPAPYHPTEKLVVSGLYRFTRNPMYVGVIMALLGEALFSDAALLFIYAGVVFLIFHAFVIVFEEPALRSRFGEAYERYCESVPRWLIKLK